MRPEVQLRLPLVASAPDSVILDATPANQHEFSSIEICAGAGGQALGLELAGFRHECVVEIEPKACDTLRANRKEWPVVQGDVRAFSGVPFAGIDLLAGGVPCPPFSRAGKQLGNSDERDLFPEVIRLVDEIRPKAVMIENVRGLLDPCFTAYRTGIVARMNALGYKAEWRLLQASDFGVPQLRPRAIFVALRDSYWEYFRWPDPDGGYPPTVGAVLSDLMASRGWERVEQWARQACSIAPTLVGGSKKHGGPDLGPTRARKAWANLGVDGRGLADLPPPADFEGMPRLTVRMTARLQGFPDSWQFAGQKTAAYRQIGNAFPPPVARAVGSRIAAALAATHRNTRRICLDRES